MKRWFVVQIYAGYEEGIQSYLSRQIKQEGLEDKIGDVLVPSVEVQQMFDVDSKVGQQLFPGYMLIHMESDPEIIRLVQSAPRVIRFLGGADPVPLSQKEVERIMGQIKGDVVIKPKELPFELGAEVEISEGPFAGFMGVIEKIDEESERLTVMVSIFGRMTPVELGFNQLKR